MSASRLSIGAVASAHGVRGQFKVKPFTAAPRDIAAYGPVWAGDRQLTLQIKGMTANGLVIVAAEGVSSRDAAQALRGTALQLDRSALPDAGSDEVYHADLLGMAVLDTGGTKLGSVKAVLNHGAGDLLEVNTGQGVVLLPFSLAVVPTVDLAGRRIVVDPPDGTFSDD